MFPRNRLLSSLTPTSLANMAATQWEDVGEDVRDGGPHKRNYTLMFWKEDFSLSKFLYGKHRFVKFLGLERGGAMKGSKLLLPKVCGCLQQNQPSYTYFILVHKHGSSPEFFELVQQALVDTPRNWIVIPVNSHQLSKHGSYPMGVGMVRCWGRCWGRCSGWWST